VVVVMRWVEQLKKSKYSTKDSSILAAALDTDRMHRPTTTTTTTTTRSKKRKAAADDGVAPQTAKKD